MFGRFAGLRFSRSARHTLLFTGLCINLFAVLGLLARPRVGSTNEYVVLCLLVSGIALASYFLAGGYSDFTERWGARVLACLLPLTGVVLSVYLRVGATA